MWNIIEFEELDSTNTLAAELLARGEAKHGDVIQARHQTAGRGRVAGRVWNDERNASLLMSIILTNVPEPFHMLQYRTALATLRALRNVAVSIPSHFQLKWPNDILLNAKKVCGILVESEWNAMEMRSAILGIGVNVNQKEFPPELHEIATSLAQQGIDVDVNAIRDALLQEFEFEMNRYRTEASIRAELQREFEWMSRVPEWTLIGTDEIEISELRFEGIATSGELLLRNVDGALLTIRSGTLRPSAL